jgi:hypothetical protein
VRSRRLLPAGRWAEALVVLAFIAAAVGITWRLWAHPATVAPTAFGANVNPDVYLSTWFMRYVANALTHGHLPALITTAINSPQGVNAMWNTSLLAPAFLLTPVTLIAGPVASLTVLLTLGFAGSATSLYIVLRRWGASIAAAALGGAFYGFMPAMLVAGQDHYHLQFAILPPLIIDAVLLLVTGRGRTVRTGLWLGVLVSLQFFTAEELLVDTGLAVLVILIVLMLARPWAIRRRLRPTLGGAGIALAVAAVICGRALWVQFIGPLVEHGSPWNVFAYGYPPSSYVTAPSAMLIHGNFTQYLLTTHQHPIEEFGYLGWPLQILLIAVPFVFWRDIRIRVIGLAVLLMELLQLGGHSVLFIGRQSIAGTALPWHWIQHLPVLNQLIIVRLSIVSDGAAAVALALVADRVIAALRGRESLIPGPNTEHHPWHWPRFVLWLWRRRPFAGKIWARRPFAGKILARLAFFGRAWRRVWRLVWRRPAFLGRLWRRRPFAGRVLRWPAFMTERWRRRALVGAAAAAVIGIAVPLIPRPVSAGEINQPPRGWTTVISQLHLPAGAPVLILPIDGAYEMGYQAITNERISVTGGYCIAPDPAGQATKCNNGPMQTAAERTVALRSFWLAYRRGAPGPSPMTFAYALGAWRPSALVIVDANRLGLRNYLIGVLGQPTSAHNNVMGWRITPQVIAGLPARIQALQSGNGASAG